MTRTKEEVSVAASSGSDVTPAEEVGKERRMRFIFLLLKNGELKKKEDSFSFSSVILASVLWCKGRGTRGEAGGVPPLQG